jgi:hypothetical protein
MGTPGAAFLFWKGTGANENAWGLSTAGARKIDPV